MSEVITKHLILVRHGESEGDVRRAMREQPTSDELIKHPRNEEQTDEGHRQSMITGQYIAKFVLGRYGFDTFDWQLTSPLIRTKQSADSLDITGKWREDERLAERDRGEIQGMTKKQHREQFPESYRQMLEYPFHWSPPGGESLLRVSVRFGELVDEFMQSKATSAIFMTHRDLLWAAHVSLDKVPLDKIQDIDTSAIHNGYIAHYMNINPITSQVSSTKQLWKRTQTPWLTGTVLDAADWKSINDIAS